MRLGRERPRKQEARVANATPAPPFNEAGARTPQKDGARRLPVVRALRPSMRLGRERPRKGCSMDTEDRHNRTFNEAGARTPQKARRAKTQRPAGGSLQ